MRQNCTNTENYLFSINCATLWSSLAKCLWQMIFWMIAVITELWLSNSSKQTGASRDVNTLRQRMIHTTCCMSCASCFQSPLWCACSYKWAKKQKGSVKCIIAARCNVMSFCHWWTEEYTLYLDLASYQRRHGLAKLELRCFLIPTEGPVDWSQRPRPSSCRTHWAPRECCILSGSWCLHNWWCSPEQGRFLSWIGLRGGQRWQDSQDRWRILLLRTSWCSSAWSSEGYPDSLPLTTVAKCKNRKKSPKRALKKW